MREIFCLASGPSLTAEDAALVRAWREAAPRSERGVIVANTTFRLAPWADMLYGMDRQWWNVHRSEVLDTFKGDKYSSARQDTKLNVTELKRPAFDHFSNSGAGAVALAILKGATTVYLLGYDCKRTGGKSHWHGDHPKPLTNGASIPRWVRFFERLAKHAEKKGVKIVNCTRDSALQCFPRARFEDVVSIPKAATLAEFVRAPDEQRDRMAADLPNLVCAAQGAT